jgi:hypothetical protein
VNTISCLHSQQANHERTERKGTYSAKVACKKDLFVYFHQLHDA